MSGNKIKTISFSKKGVAFSDFCAESAALQFYQDPNGDKISVSTENFINAIRCLIKEKVIPCKEVVFEFNGILLHPTLSGRIADWPDGFCDYNEKFYLRLL